MTLEEKFNKLVPKEFGGMHEPLLSDCQKVADDYAIDFAQWVQFHSELWIKYKTSELLEIFKKEKVL